MDSNDIPIILLINHDPKDFHHRSVMLSDRWIQKPGSLRGLEVLTTLGFEKQEFLAKWRCKCWTYIFWPRDVRKNPWFAGLYFFYNQAACDGLEWNLSSPAFLKPWFCRLQRKNRIPPEMSKETFFLETTYVILHLLDLATIIVWDPLRRVELQLATLPWTRPGRVDAWPMIGIVRKFHIQLPGLPGVTPPNMLLK